MIVSMMSMVTSGVSHVPSNAPIGVKGVMSITLTALLTLQIGKNRGVRVALVMLIGVMIVMNITLTDAILARIVVAVSSTITITDPMQSSTLPIRMNACSLG
jgi:hypothetical protein